MGGIAGFWNKNRKPADLGRLVAMRDSMYHRGPDAAGEYLAEDLAFGHRRLSILDLSPAANQPFVSPCGRFVLVYNGEIFNYKDFYPELKAKGYLFQTFSDTEVLLFLLMEYGTSALPRLNGFFAFAFWEQETRSLTLVRDRFGVKPLFWAETAEGLAFASEPKAIHAWGLKKKIASSHLDELFFYRHVSGENTIFEGIERILPGNFQVWKDGVILERTVRWYHLGEEAASFEKISDPKAWYQETFFDSVRLRMSADVPVGTQVSGGLDSSSVLYAQHHLGFKGLSAWNLKFSGLENDASHLASRLSEEYGFEYQGHGFVGENLDDLLRESIKKNDEPLMHFSDGVLLGLSKKAKEKVGVLLTGEGADEVMGGYVRQKLFGSEMRYQLLQLLQYVPMKWLKEGRWREMKRHLNVRNAEFQILTNANELFMKDLKKLGLGSLNLIPDYRVKVLEEAKKFFPRNKLRQLLYLEMHTHLCSLNDKTDRVSMGASLECREPFLDYRLVTGITSLPDSYLDISGRGKWLLVNTLGKKLPDYIQNHKKVSLEIPWGKYFFENPVFRAHLETMHESPLFQIGWLAYLDVRKIVADYKTDPITHYPFLRALFFHSYWYKTIFLD